MVAFFLFREGKKVGTIFHFMSGDRKLRRTEDRNISGCSAGSPSLTMFSLWPGDARFARE